MIIPAIIAFGVMCLTAFAVGCGIAKLEIWMREKERKEHDE